MAFILRGSGATLAAALGALAGLCLGPIEAHAATVFTSDLVVGNINSDGLCDGSQSLSNHGTDSVPRLSCSGATWSETAVANAQFGDLRASADLRFDGFDFATDTDHAAFEAKASAGFFDTLTFSKGATWEFTVGVSGQSVLVKGDGQTFDDYNAGWWCFNMFGAGCGISGYGVTRLGTETFQATIPQGGSLAINPRLDIDIEALMLRDGQGDPPPYLPLTQDSYVDLSHTVQIVSSRVLDADGLPIADATITAESGFDYLHPVPEPGTPSSATIGLGTLCLWRRARRGRFSAVQPHRRTVA